MKIIVGPFVNDLVNVFTQIDEAKKVLKEKAVRECLKPSNPEGKKD